MTVIEHDFTVPVKPDFERFYSENYRKVLQYLKRHISSREDAEDLTNDVFVYCYESYDRYDPNKSAIATWLYLIVNSRLKNYYRDRRSFVELEALEDILPGEETDMGRAVYLEQLRAELAAALTELPERQRQVVTMRYFEEKSYDEIAQSIGASPGNTRVLLSRALDRLGLLCQKIKD